MDGDGHSPAAALSFGLETSDEMKQVSPQGKYQRKSTFVVCCRKPEFPPR